MGPLPFSSGNCSATAGTSRTRTRFNGATAFQQWKLVDCLMDLVATNRLQWGHCLSAVETGSYNPDRRLAIPLQWGHCLSAVETRPLDSRHDRLGDASMGPLPFSSGNTPARAGQPAP